MEVNGGTVVGVLAEQGMRSVGGRRVASVEGGDSPRMNCYECTDSRIGEIAADAFLLQADPTAG